MEKPVVEITYCTGCRWLLRAGWIAQELLTTFERDLGGVLLRPGEGGVFEIRVGGALIFSRREEGGFIDAAEIKRRIRDVVAPGKPLGHIDRQHSVP